MQLTIHVAEEIGQRLQRLPAPDKFVTQALTTALREQPVQTAFRSCRCHLRVAPAPSTPRRSTPRAATAAPPYAF